MGAGECSGGLERACWRVVDVALNRIGTIDGVGHHSIRLAKNPRVARGVWCVV